MISVTTIFWFLKMNEPKKINKNANDSVNHANIVICMLTICRRFLLDLIDFDKVFRNLAIVSVWILKNDPSYVRHLLAWIITQLYVRSYKIQMLITYLNETIFWNIEFLLKCWIPWIERYQSEEFCKSSIVRLRLYPNRYLTHLYQAIWFSSLMQSWVSFW